MSRRLADKGWLTLAWPEGVRRPGPLDHGAGDLQRGDVLPQRSRNGVGHGRDLVGWPRADARRHRRSEAGAPAAHRQGRALLVHAVQRARFGFRPCVTPDFGNPRRRRLRHQRPEDMDLQRPLRRLGLAGGAHQPGRAQAPGHQPVHARYEESGRRGQADLQHGGWTRLQRGLFQRRSRA